jgi:predicted phage tail protein
MTDLVTTEDTAFPSPPARPRVRWAGVVWGLAFATLAVASIVLTRSPDAYGGLIEWVTAISIPTLIATALLTAGAAILVAGIVGMLRHAQRSLAARRATGPGADPVGETAARHTT